MAVLYAAKGGSSASDLYTLDPVTGAATLVGSIGYAVTGLAMDPTSGILYGQTSHQDPTDPDSLITIDTTTGAGTLIGATTPMGDIGFNSAGQLYGTDANVANPGLVVIDKATGSNTNFGSSSGLASAFGSAMDVNRLGDGKLYWFPKGGPSSTGSNTFGGLATYYTLDVSTHAASLVGRLTGGPVNNNPAVAAASFDASSVCWAIFNEFGATCYLVTIDVGTGAVSSVATLTGTNWDALCWSVETAAIADFSGTPTVGYAPLSVAFTDLSTGSPTSWLWDFGDGDTSSLQNPTHVYATAGVYTVSLTVDNGSGPNTDTQTDYVTVYAVDFSATPLDGVAPLTVAFTDLSTGSPTSWAWDFGDGGTSTVQNPTHVYTVPGVYDVTLTVTN